MNYIYKIKVGDYFYFGKTNSLSQRKYKHRKDCFSRSKKAYHRKLYKKIRELGIKRETFYNDIQLKIVYRCSKEETKMYEKYCINLNNDYCLNMIN